MFPAIMASRRELLATAVLPILPRAAERRAYVDARRRGEPATLAHARVRDERLGQALSWRGDDSWDVDLTSMAAQSSRWPYPLPSFPPGATATVEVTRDDDAGIDDAECWAVEDVEAWRADRWAFNVLRVTVRLQNGDRGIAALGGVALGDYWPGSFEAQMSATVAEMLTEALDDALGRTSDVSAALAVPLC